MEKQSRVLRARLHLIGDLRAGTRAPGASISVKETATMLKLSHTPVREALAGLAGEGIVAVTADRSGFAVPRLGTHDLVELLELYRLMVQPATVTSLVAGVQPPLFGSTIPDDPAGAVEVAIAWMIAGSDNDWIKRLIGRLNVMLAPYRRHEPQVFPDWTDELTDLVNALHAGREAPLHAYWQRRIDHASAIVDAIDSHHRAPDILRI